MSTIAIIIVTGLYFFSAVHIGYTTNNWWWTGFWGSYGTANICWLKATGAI